MSTAHPIDSTIITTIEDCARSSLTGALHFGAVVARLDAASVESYHVDYRRGVATYYLPSGAAHAVPMPMEPDPAAGAIPEAFAAEAVHEAVRGAQSGAVQYPEFVRRTRAAGCVGYHVWISGQHVVYLGRRGESCSEPFPAAPPTEPARPNVLLVQRLYDAFRRRDFPAAFALFAPDLVIEQSGEVPWGGHFAGHAGARDFFAKLGHQLSSTLALERLIDAGDHVVAVGRTRGTVNATGASYDVPIAHAWQVQGGQLVRAHFMIDNPTMLAALA